MTIPDYPQLCLSGNGNCDTNKFFLSSQQEKVSPSVNAKMSEKAETPFKRMQPNIFAIQIALCFTGEGVLPRIYNGT